MVERRTIFPACGLIIAIGMSGVSLAGSVWPCMHPYQPDGHILASCAYDVGPSGAVYALDVVEEAPGRAMIAKGNGCLGPTHGVVIESQPSTVIHGLVIDNRGDR